MPCLVGLYKKSGFQWESSLTSANTALSLYEATNWSSGVSKTLVFHDRWHYQPHYQPHKKLLPFFSDIIFWSFLDLHFLGMAWIKITNYWNHRESTTSMELWYFEVPMALWSQWSIHWNSLDSSELISSLQRQIPEKNSIGFTAQGRKAKCNKKLHGWHFIFRFQMAVSGVNANFFGLSHFLEVFPDKHRSAELQLWPLKPILFRDLRAAGSEFFVDAATP